MRTATTLTLVVALLCPAIARAEYTRVELKIFGMDCATCAHGVRVAVQKVEGVESVELSLERAQADIRLLPGNRVTLDRFRKIVKGNGFEPKEAVVSATGTVRDNGGRLMFDVSGVGATLVVAADKTAPGILKSLKIALEAKPPTPLDITGSVSVSKDGVETITVTSAKTRP